MMHLKFLLYSCAVLDFNRAVFTCNVEVKKKSFFLRVGKKKALITFKKNKVVRLAW